jgi:hypothetical protein
MEFFDDEYDSIIIIDDYNTNSETESNITESTTFSDIINNSNTQYIQSNYNQIYNEVDDDRSMSYYNAIYDMEDEFINSEKKDGQYVIGISASGYYRNSESIFACGITARTFFLFPFRNILKYLFYYSVINVYYPVIDIIKIHIDKDDTYISVRKTHWLCLIQRHWRKIMAERNDIYKKRRSLYSLFYREIKGKYPSGLNSLPVLKGMLSCYSSKKS